ncbi:hypothetical protein HK405_000210, partial [Cladochytrium tenue]
MPTFAAAVPTVSSSAPQRSARLLGWPASAVPTLAVAVAIFVFVASFGALPATALAAPGPAPAPIPKATTTTSTSSTRVSSSSTTTAAAASPTSSACSTALRQVELDVESCGSALGTADYPTTAQHEAYIQCICEVSGLSEHVQALADSCPT